MIEIEVQKCLSRQLWITSGPKNQTICDKNSWDENSFIKMFISIAIVNLCEFSVANYDFYKKSQQLESNKQFFRQKIHASKNLFIKSVYNNQLKY